MSYEFTNGWFETTAKNFWTKLLPEEKPRRILEIGSFEGASTCFLIENASHDTLEIHCVDTWEGGIENDSTQMPEIERRFLQNTKVASDLSQAAVTLEIHKGMSNEVLPRLIANGKKGYFDLVYVDGSHQATDVLLDAVLAFQLVRVGGLIIFDDYLWKYFDNGNPNLVMSPKLAIDSFTNVYFAKVKLQPGPVSQIYARKISE